MADAGSTSPAAASTWSSPRSPRWARGDPAGDGGAASGRARRPPAGRTSIASRAPLGLRAGDAEREPRRRRWVLDGAKRWIGNGSIADVVVVWARSDEDGQVKGFLVEKDTDGFEAATMEGKGASRAPSGRLRSASTARACPRRRGCRGRALQGRRPRPRHDPHDVRLGRLGQPLLAYDARSATASSDRSSAGRSLVPPRSGPAGRDARRGHRRCSCTHAARRRHQTAAALTDTIAGAELNNTRKAARSSPSARPLGGNGVLLENHVIRHMGDIEVIHTLRGHRDDADA